MTTRTSSAPTKRKRKVALVAAALVGAASVGAYAFWTSTGAGTGSAATSSGAAAVTVVQTSTVSGLAPGLAPQTLSGNFDNPNSGPVYITDVTASISSVTKDAGAPAGTCDASDYTLSNAVMNVGAEVPAGNAQGSWTGATIAFNNKPGTNQDACKGATVNLAYTAN
jgi:hypothetical protein